MPGSDPAGSLALPVLDAFVPVLRSVTFDCHDPYVLAYLWTATGYRKGASPEPGFERLAGPGAEKAEPRPDR